MKAWKPTLKYPCVLCRFDSNAKFFCCRQVLGCEFLFAYNSDLKAAGEAGKLKLMLHHFKALT